MKKLLESNWLVPVAGALVFLVTLAVLGLKLVAPLAAKTRAAAAAHAGAHPVKTASTNLAPQPMKPSWAFSNPEMDQLLEELRREKEAFATREKQLSEWEARLKIEQVELLTLTQAVHRMQMEFDQTVVKVQAEEVANCKRLAKLYSTMEPEAAAAVFKEMEDTPLIKVMAFMKETETAAILEIMAKKGETSAKRVATLSDRLRMVTFRNPTEKPKS